MLAEAFATRDPARIIDVFAEVNVCEHCMARKTVMELFLDAMGASEGAEG